MTTTTETVYSGDPLEFIAQGLKNIPTNVRRGHSTLEQPIEETYGTDVSEGTANIFKRIRSSSNPVSLLRAMRMCGLHERDDTDKLMKKLDVKITDGHCSRENDASEVTSKSNRDSIYVPDLLQMAEDGDIYMAKSLSSGRKVKIAWDLDDDNEVVVVDEYETWGELLGWKKLKTLPHGKNKIREELGDQLSDEVLEEVAGTDDDSDSSSSDSSSSSRGRKTRTKPSEELLNLARGTRRRRRRKMRSKEIADDLENGDMIANKIHTLVLFPTTTDKNMTDHWWIPGRTSNGWCAIANCNKGTFEYLNRFESVWHVDDYIDQASSYEFDASVGPVTLDSVDTSRLFVHIVSEKTQSRVMRSPVFENMPQAIIEHYEEDVYNSPDLPSADEMIYAPITAEDVFWLRPALRRQNGGDDESANVAYADERPRDLGGAARSLASDYKLYARARLPDWSLDSIEMKKVSKASHYFRLDDGGFEMLETLGMLHDQGKQPFSESPKARWVQ